MKRYMHRGTQVAIDVVALSAALAVAFLVRFDGVPPADMVGRFALTAPYVVAGEYLVFMMYGVPRFSWRYVGMREAAAIGAAAFTSTLGLIAVRLALGALQTPLPYLRHGVIPLGVIVVNAALALLAVLGVRVVRRWIGERVDSRRFQRPSQPVPVATMLVGAGQGGVMMAKEIVSRPDLGLRAVGFLDDDPSKHGTIIHGIPVLGPPARLGELCEKHDAQQVLVTMASAPGGIVRSIHERCEEAGLPVKIIPGLWELADGAVSVSRIRDVAIEDLLGRATVRLDLDAIGALLRGKTVLVTGAGGSIGSELCRQIMRFEPARLVLAERSENALFEIHRELTGRGHGDRLMPVMVDIFDKQRVDTVFRETRPDIVLHAAAHKHVPMMELNPGEALKNNVCGTAAVARAADRYGAERFVMISTDKAVNPTSVMGASKRMAEMFVQSLAPSSATRFATVRFGNVLGSAGSVIPIFREQIAQGGPVTVTHPEMRRYFMTIPEACQLVLQASAMGQGGEIFVLDMGEPVRIVDLARDLIRLSGLRPEIDIPIEFTGIRPGEKLFEEIATDSEQAEKTDHPKIFVGRTRSPSHDVACKWVDEIPSIVEQDVAARRLLREAVPEYSTTAPPPRAADTEEVPAAHGDGPRMRLAAAK